MREIQDKQREQYNRSSSLRIVTEEEQMNLKRSLFEKLMLSALTSAYSTVMAMCILAKLDAPWLFKVVAIFIVCVFIPLVSLWVIQREIEMPRTMEQIRKDPLG